MYMIRTHRLEVVDCELDVEGLSHGDQVQHGVGGPSQGHDDHHRVLERRAGYDVLRLQVLSGREKKNTKHTHTCKVGIFIYFILFSQFERQQVDFYYDMIYTSRLIVSFK